MKLNPHYSKPQFAVGHKVTMDDSGIEYEVIARQWDDRENKWTYDLVLPEYRYCVSETRLNKVEG